MDECRSDHGWWPQVNCILTYGGSQTDIAINYSILLINMTACALLLGWDSRTNQRRALLSFGFTVTFQIVLCMALGCAGISIIWCASAGWMMQRQRRNSQTEALVDACDEVMLSQSNESQLLVVGRQVALVVDAAAILYYLWTAEFITTVAHSCAVVMGMLLYRPANEWTSLPAEAPSNVHPLLRESLDSE